MLQPVLRWTWLGIVALVATVSAAASAALPARPEGPVYDGANIIAPADIATLDAKLRAYNESTGRAVVVATVPSLDGREVEEYAQDLAEAWAIGGAESENGVLFLVAPNERRMRIATARGVQERLTDIMSGRIIRDVITPRFKAGDVSGGIVAGVDAIVRQLDMDPAQAKAIEEAEKARAAQEREDAKPAIAGVIFWIVMIVFFVLLMARRGGGRRYRGGGAADAIGNVVLWTAINAAMNSGHSRNHGGFGSGGFGGTGGGSFGGGGGGFGGFGGGGGGFNGGGASGGW